MKQQEHQPPKWADRLLEWFCKEEHLEILQGDLYELFQYRLEKYGQRKANLHYIKDVVDLMRPFAIKKLSNHLTNSTVMYRNYFKIGFRNLLKNKGFSLINISGLAIGLGCFILIALYVVDELSYDRFHKNASSIYRVTVQELGTDREIVERYSFTSPMHGVILKQDFPEVEEAVRFYPWNFPVISYKDKKFQENDFVFAEQSMFDVFTFEFLEGNPQAALKEPNTVVITKTIAQKLFGNEPALGKSMEYQGYDGTELLLEVTGVVRDFPEQSHFAPTYVGSFASLEQTFPPEDLNDYFGNYNFPTYIKVGADANAQDLQAKMPALLDNYIDNIQGQKASAKINLYLQPLTDIHLGIGVPGGIGSTGSIAYIYLFSAIGLLILIIACFNYINLTTAKYANRLKEIGVRKVLGAVKGHISTQFLCESLLVAVIALGLGYGLARFCLPYVNEFTNKQLSLSPEQNWLVLPFLLLLAIIVGLFAGTYPAVFMARYRPIKALQNIKSRQSFHAYFRSGLVVFQFAVTIALLFGVGVIDQQIRFINGKDLGYDREQIISFYSTDSIANHMETFKSQLRQNPEVLEVTASSRIPTETLGDVYAAAIFKEGQIEPLNLRIPFVRIDEDYFPTYGVDLAAGRNFSQEFRADNAGFILNQSAVETIGWESSKKAIGQQFKYGNITGQVIGVVNDFNFESIHQAIEPLVFVNDTRFRRRISAKIAANNVPATIRHIESVYETFETERDFAYTFLDDAYAAMYESEQRLSQISKVFSILAILIACLGLIGLISFTAEQKAKEISIRKVLGAPVSSILLLLNKQYLHLIAIAFLIAIPTTWYFLQDWLNEFAYRINISIRQMVVAGLLALFLALLTVSYQSLKAAFANPVENLRDE